MPPTNQPASNLCGEKTTRFCSRETIFFQRNIIAKKYEQNKNKSKMMIVCVRVCICVLYVYEYTRVRACKMFITLNI